MDITIIEKAKESKIQEKSLCWIRKPQLYPFELRGKATPPKNIPARANGNAISLCRRARIH
jgi:hypothetical protein